MSQKILLLIDLQKKYPAALDSNLITVVCTEIWNARRENIPIISLNYYTQYDIVDKIEMNLHGYRNLHTIVKYINDGSINVRYILYKLGLENADFYVCGVNTDACVRETVESLYHCNKNFKINIIANGCNTESQTNHDNQINSFIANNRFRILHRQIESPYGYDVLNEGNGNFASLGRLKLYTKKILQIATISLFVNSLFQYIILFKNA